MGKKIPAIAEELPEKGETSGTIVETSESVIVVEKVDSKLIVESVETVSVVEDAGSASVVEDAGSASVVEDEVKVLEDEKVDFASFGIGDVLSNKSVENCVEGDENVRIDLDNELNSEAETTESLEHEGLEASVESEPKVRQWRTRRKRRETGVVFVQGNPSDHAPEP